MTSYVGRASGRRVAWRRRRINAVAPVTGTPVVLNGAGAGESNGTTLATFTTGTIVPADDALCYIVERTRSSSVATVHNQPTTTIPNTVIDAASVIVKLQSNAAANTHLRTSVWKMKTTGSAGAGGTVTCTTSTATLQREVEIIYVPSGTGVVQSKSNGYLDTDATDPAVVVFDTMPGAANLTLGIWTSNSASSVGRTPTPGATGELTDNHVANLAWETHFFRGGSPQTLSVPGTTTLQRSMIGIEVN